jgi:HEAT repeat protein
MGTRFMLAILLIFLSWAAAPHDAADVDRAWTVLKEGVENKSSERRAKAVHALGLLTNNQRAREWAEKALQDPNADVRVEAAKALGQMGAISARPKLRNQLNDTEIKVVLAAANSLYVLKDPAAYEVFYALLRGERKSSVGLVQTQVERLKNRREMEKLAFETGIGFVPFGSMGYEAWKTVTHDDSTPVRVAAAAKLAHDPDPKSGEGLAGSCADKKWQIRAASAEAIANRGDPALLQAVIPLLLDGNDTVRSEAASAVIRLSAPHIRPGRFHK